MMANKPVTRMFVVSAAATAVIGAPVAAAVWADAAAGSTHMTVYADPSPPGCPDVTDVACAPGNAGVSIPGADANAGPNFANVNIPDANANAGPNNANVNIPGANANAGPDNASVNIPDANANAGPNNASVSIPGANANAGPGYFTGCINAWCWG
jgi:hypothetical protein